jgi:CheY-like chemotaxis protein
MKASPWYRVRFLIADDQKDFAVFLERMVCALGHEVAEVITTGGLSVIQAFEKHKPDVVLMDFHMPQFNGMTACRHILSKHPEARIVVMSGDSSLDRAAAKAGAVAAIRKPFTGVDLGRLLESLEHADVTPAADAVADAPAETGEELHEPVSSQD